jgi:isopenicillin N synthase-like dioxygenase
MEPTDRLVLDAASSLLRDGFALLQADQSIAGTLSSVFSSGYEFFRLPLEDKTRNTLPEDAGYRPFGAEYSKSSDSPDRIETFTASDRSRRLADALPALSARRLHNLMMQAADGIEPIAEALVASLAHTVRGQVTPIQRGALRRWSRVQLNYSQPMVSPNALINDEHEDGVLLTFAVSTGPGMELRDRSAAFVPIATSPSRVLVMPGEIAWLLSGGALQPQFHRVLADPACAEREALLYFVDLDPSQCTPWVANAINDGIDIGERVIRSAHRFGLKGFNQT